MHVCFVAPQAWPVLSADSRIGEVGGAEVQQSILARLLAAHGYRVSMICLDYGQPERALIDGVTVHKAYRPDEGVPLLRFLHPRLTAMWRALREADADVYYTRTAGMLAGVVAEFCRRHGRRSIYAGASDKDFVPGAGGQIRYARDRWLYRRGLALVDRIVAQNEVQRSSCRATYGRDAVVIPSCYQLPKRRDGNPPPKDSVLWVGVIRAGKRPELLLELARRLPQRRFVMVGGPGAAMRRCSSAPAPRPRRCPTSSSPVSFRCPRWSRASTRRACSSTPRTTKGCRTRSSRPGRAAYRRSAPWTRARARIAASATSRPARAKSKPCSAIRNAGGRLRALPRALRAQPLRSETLARYGRLLGGLAA
jgi:hypothetical protein